MIDETAADRLLGTWLARTMWFETKRHYHRVTVEFRVDGWMRLSAVRSGEGSKLTKIRKFRYRLQDGLILVRLAREGHVTAAGFLPSSGGPLTLTLDGCTMNLVRDGLISTA